jgi:hypothetical protein
MPSISQSQIDAETLLALGPFGGLDTTTAPFYVAQNNYPDGENFLPNQSYGSLITTLGRALLGTAYPGGGTLQNVGVRGITKMYRTGAANAYIAVVDAEIANVTTTHLISAVGSGRAWTTAFMSTPAALTPGHQAYFAADSDWIFFTNGFDTPLKIDTSLNVTYWGIVAPTTAITATAGGAGNLNGTYYWVTTFGNSVQESSEGLISAPLTVSNQQVNLTTIPTSPDPQVTKRSVYRVGGSSGIWELVVTLNDNTTTTYTDNIGDTALGVALVPRRDPPPIFVAICSHKERVWGVTVASDVYWSNFQEPWGFNVVDNTRPVGETAFGDNPVNLASISTQLLIVKDFSCYQVLGTTDADFQVLFVAPVGCSSGPSLASAYGMAGWINNGGVWMFNGQLQQVSDGQFGQSNIKETIDTLSDADLNGACGAWYQRMYLISFPYDLAKTYLLDLRTNQWFRLGWAFTQAYFDLYDRLNPLVTDNNPDVLTDNSLLLTWFQDGTDLGDPVTAYVLSRVSDSGDVAATKDYAYIIVEAPGQPNATCSIQLTVNPGLQQYQWSKDINLGVPLITDTGTRHVVRPPRSMKGFEVQLRVAVTATTQTLIESAQVQGSVFRRLIPKG